MNEDLTFDEWFDIFVDQTKKMGYIGIINKWPLEWDYYFGITPENSATEFVKNILDQPTQNEQKETI